MGNGLTINLLPKTKAILGGSKFKYIIVIGSLVLAGAAVFLSVNLYILGNIYKGQLSTLSSQIQVEESSIQAMAGEEASYVISQDKLAQISKLLLQGAPVSKKIDTFMQLVSKDLEIETLSITDKDFNVTVKTASLFSLESFFEALVNKDAGGVFLQNIVLLGINEDAQGFFKASIAANIK